MSAEFPGFHLPDSPVFTGARGTSIFTGDMPNITPMLDLAMVFGCRLWGHDLPLADGPTLGAPGVGDLFTHDARERATAALCERVGRETDTEPETWRSLVLHTGSEAVETAIKTAVRATGRTQLAAFEGGYHGTFGLAMSVTHRPAFRIPWASQLANTVTWTPFGTLPDLTADIACVVVEPWQGRAGVIEPPRGFLRALRSACNRVGALLVLDAVLCGSGRTGATIAQDIADARPDIVCLGKALGSGYAASAVVCRADIAAAAWECGPVEPAHTSTTLGDPVSCVGVLHSLRALDACREELAVQASAWHDDLRELSRDTWLGLRGLGLLWALDTRRAGGGFELARVLRDQHGMLVVPSGEDASSITLYPAAVTSELERERFCLAVRAAVGSDT